VPVPFGQTADGIVRSRRLLRLALVSTGVAVLPGKWLIFSFFVPSRLGRMTSIHLHMKPSKLFHPAVANWFAACFEAPTPAQSRAWLAIKARQHTLIAAPTGSGKTLAAFLAAIDDLIRQGLSGTLADETQIVYVSPLKALSNDIHRNLEVPLAGISEQLLGRGLPEVDIRTWVRTGDTPPAERERMRRRPPHILVTTPESLYVLLGSESGRRMLSTTRCVIVDEIHAIAANKRGAHLALSLERLAALCGDCLLRIGLSATQNPIDAIADLLAGAKPDGTRSAEVTIIDTGHQRTRELTLEVPDSPLETVMSNEVWQQVYDRVVDWIKAHRTTLVFVNTRKMAERVAHELSNRIADGTITAHHGSMAKEHRLGAERKLKQGQLKALVATASLELGIDIGDVDLVCQLGSPATISWNAPRCSTAFVVGNLIGWSSPTSLSTCSRNRSWPRSRRRIGLRQRCTTACGGPGPTAS
jgi:ATP-dependent helicase Lhr and Lhr-like helicase